MDPNVTLLELRRKMTVLKEGNISTKDKDRLLDALVEEFEALDEWISRGGFLPTDWRHLR